MIGFEGIDSGYEAHPNANRLADSIPYHKTDLILPKRIQLKAKEQDLLFVEVSKSIQIG